MGPYALYRTNARRQHVSRRRLKKYRKNALQDMIPSDILVSFMLRIRLAASEDAITESVFTFDADTTTAQVVCKSLTPLEPAERVHRFYTSTVPNGSPWIRM